jgi:hypothetical protein
MQVGAPQYVQLVGDTVLYPVQAAISFNVFMKGHSQHSVGDFNAIFL